MTDDDIEPNSPGGLVPADRRSELVQIQAPVLTANPLVRYLEGPKLKTPTSRATMRRMARRVAAELLGYADRGAEGEPTDPAGALWTLLALPAAVGAVEDYHVALQTRVDLRLDLETEDHPKALSASAANLRLTLLRGVVRAAFTLRDLDGKRPFDADHRQDLLDVMAQISAGGSGRTRLEDGAASVADQEQATLDDQEVIRLDVAATNRGPESRNRTALDRALLALASLGLRRAEIASLKWGAIRETKQAGKVLQVLGKGKKRREIPITKGAALLLEDWQFVCEEGGLDVSKQAPVLRRLYRGRNGGDSLKPEGISDSTVYRRLQSIMREADIEVRGAHSFRRYAITALLRSGVDLTSVQAFAGHSDPRTTAGYHVEAAEERINRLRRGAADPFRRTA